MEDKSQKIKSMKINKEVRKNLTISIKSKATIELLKKLEGYIEKSHFSRPSEMYEIAFALGLELMINNKLEENKSIFNHVEDVTRKYKNYTVKEFDKRIVNILKYFIVNEKKINLIINCLSERNIIDAPYFIESQQAISLTEDVPWIRQLKLDLDADFSAIETENIDDLLKGYTKQE